MCDPCHPYHARYLTIKEDQEDNANVTQRDFDLHAMRDALRLEILQGFVSGTDTPTYSYVASTANKLLPRPCHPGTFCLGGVREPLTIVEWLPSNPDGQFAPQKCSEGTYCDYGTRTPAGTGPCFAATGRNIWT